MFNDTFGENTPNEGGVPMTEAGPFDEARFLAPPGYVVRGIAGAGDELLIGHSHKGERAKRFDGKGALLVYKVGHFACRLDMPASQVYQLMREDGGTVDAPAPILAAAEISGRLKGLLGEPIYEAATIRL